MKLLNDVVELKHDRCIGCGRYIIGNDKLNESSNILF